MARVSSGLQCTLARLHKRLAALERFIGCEVDGTCAERLQLDVNLERCSPVLIRAYGEEGLALTYLSVYAGFAVLVVGSAGAMYKSNAEFNHHVDGTHYRFYLQGAGADAITLQGYMRGFFSVMAYEAVFSLVTAPWEGEWVVEVGGEVQVAKYSLFGKGEADAWAPGCAEIVMDGATITFRWKDGKEVAWGMQEVQPAGFNTVVTCGEKHSDIPLRFDVHARDYNHLQLRVARGGQTYVTYALKRNVPVVLRPLPPPLADAAEKRVILNVAKYESDPGLKDLFKEWCKQVELCVHKKCALLKLGKEGRPFKQIEDPLSENSYTSLVYKLNPKTTMYRSEYGWRPISFKLTGDQFRVVLWCFYTEPQSLSGQMAFNIPFMWCKVWEGDWSVQQVTPLDGVPKWNTMCNAISLTDTRWMKLMHSSGVAMTSDDWRIDSDPEPLWFRASQLHAIVACSVQVEDYNHIKLHVQTESYSESERKTVRVPTVEYTLTRKHTF